MKEISVRDADAAFGQGDVLLSTLGLGSCIAIALYDRQAHVAGLAHILLPSEALARDRDNRAKFAQTAVPLLLERMRAIGARDAYIVAKLACGASM
jgi:chemotaxis protein CheD